MKEIKINKLKEIIYYEKLDNGLEVYMFVNNKTNNYYASYNIKYGSVDTNFKVNDKEYKITNGSAHFLEHIKFNLSDNTSANEYFDNYGTGCNAYTTYDHTSYLIYGTNNIYNDVIKLISMIDDKYITDEIIEQEKGIIIEEESMVKNDINQNLYNEIMKSIYKNSNKKYLITGTKEEIEKINKKELELIYDNFYNPSNSFLVITGNFNPYELLAIIKENQKNKKYKNKVSKINIKEDNKVYKPYKIITGNINTPIISINYKMDRKLFKDISDIELDIYINILLDYLFGNISTIYNDLINKRLINDLYYSYIIEKDNVIISLEITSKYIDEIINRVEEYINNIKINDLDINRYIKCNIASLIIGFNNIEYVNDYIVNNIINYNKINNNIYDINQNISIDNIKKIINHLNFNNRAIIIIKKDIN